MPKPIPSGEVRIAVSDMGRELLDPTKVVNNDTGNLILVFDWLVEVDETYGANAKVGKWPMGLNSFEPGLEFLVERRGQKLSRNPSPSYPLSLAQGEGEEKRAGGYP